MKKTAILSIALAAAVSAAAQNPVWLEADAAVAIKSRTLHDFSLTFELARQEINKRYNANFDSAKIRDYANKKYIETQVIDGVERVHRKSPGNLKLLNPE